MLQEEARKVFGLNGVVNKADISTINYYIHQYGVNVRDPRPSRVSCVQFNDNKLVFVLQHIDNTTPLVVYDNCNQELLNCCTYH